MLKRHTEKEIISFGLPPLDSFKKSESNIENISGALDSDLSRLKTVVRKLAEHPDAKIFRFPVNPNHAPNYYEVIKNPMDLSTIETNINSNLYVTSDDFSRDVELIFLNCYKYNYEGSAEYSMGKSLERYFGDIYFKKMNESEKKKSLEILDNFESLDISGPFRIPVPIQFVEYHRIIKNPMDFGTIRKNIKNNKISWDVFCRDVKQVFLNCFLFNLPVFNILYKRKLKFIKLVKIWKFCSNR